MTFVRKPNLTFRARSLRIESTSQERKLWSALRAHRFFGKHFKRQQSLGPYVTDFYCHACKLIIEIDGAQHGLEEGKKYDEYRTQYFTQLGYRVLRFWNNDVDNAIEKVLENISSNLS
ncbi:MAG TPA: DUF559 domain-containing protein [Patescibacteria group bacterium]|nr:DUF559 domain-containing protein [Patescibacteria group bacterium]